jgi:hypothetical protein
MGPGRVSLLIAFLAVGYAAPTIPHWVGDGVHSVDGYWVLAERPCDLESADPCGDFVRAGVDALGVDPKTVTRGATAGLPVEWMRSNGRVAWVGWNSTGLQQFVLLDLVDGSRRAVGIGCLPVPRSDGSAICCRSPLDAYLVGHEPIDDRSVATPSR